MNSPLPKFTFNNRMPRGVLTTINEETENRQRISPSHALRGNISSPKVASGKKVVVNKIGIHNKENVLDQTRSQLEQNSFLKKTGLLSPQEANTGYSGISRQLRELNSPQFFINPRMNNFNALIEQSRDDNRPLDLSSARQNIPSNQQCKLF